MGIDRREFPTEMKDCYVSNLKVMRSGAGYYLGRTCIDKEHGFEEPYSRETGYMKKEDAEKLWQAVDTMSAIAQKMT